MAVKAVFPPTVVVAASDPPDNTTATTTTTTIAAIIAVCFHAAFDVPPPLGQNEGITFKNII